MLCVAFGQGLDAHQFWGQGDFGLRLVLAALGSPWLTLVLAVPAAGFLMRIFVIFHDCGHGSFFKSTRANDIVGIIAGILVFTPYYYWRHAHAVHHGTSGDLDRRGVGDMWTMTVKEYQTASPLRRLLYRAFRQPVILFGIGPVFIFAFFQRLPMQSRPGRERNSVHGTNLALLAILVLAWSTIGLPAYLLVQIPVLMLGSSVGVWLFYQQHQFEDTTWERHQEWDYFTAAMYGSSFYKLPRLLQWFTGNIGFHHIHHLDARIPNYYLETCYLEHPDFQQVTPLTLRTSLHSLKLRLWDEEQGRMVGYDALYP